MANFEAFHQVISSSINLLFLKSVLAPTHHESQQTIRPEKEIKTKKIRTKYVHTHIQIRKSNFYIKSIKKTFSFKLFNSIEELLLIYT